MPVATKLAKSQQHVQRSSSTMSTSLTTSSSTTSAVPRCIPIAVDDGRLDLSMMKLDVLPCLHAPAEKDARRVAPSSSSVKMRAAKSSASSSIDAHGGAAEVAAKIHVFSLRGNNLSSISTTTTTTTNNNNNNNKGAINRVAVPRSTPLSVFLHVSSLDLTANHLHDLDGICALPALHTLRVARNALKTLAALWASPHIHRLDLLDVSDNQLTELMCDDAAALLHLRHDNDGVDEDDDGASTSRLRLRYIYASNNSLTNISTAEMRALPNTLVELRLARNALRGLSSSSSSSSSPPLLLRRERFPNLRLINLAENHVDVIASEMLRGWAVAMGAAAPSLIGADSSAHMMMMDVKDQRPPAPTPSASSSSSAAMSKARSASAHVLRLRLERTSSMNAADASPSSARRPLTARQSSPPPQPPSTSRGRSSLGRDASSTPTTAATTSTTKVRRTLAPPRRERCAEHNAFVQNISENVWSFAVGDASRAVKMNLRGALADHHEDGEVPPRLALPSSSSMTYRTNSTMQTRGASCATSSTSAILIIDALTPEVVGDELLSQAFARYISSSLFYIDGSSSNNVANRSTSRPRTSSTSSSYRRGTSPERSGGGVDEVPRKIFSSTKLSTHTSASTPSSLANGARSTSTSSRTYVRSSSVGAFSTNMSNTSSRPYLSSASSAQLRRSTSAPNMPTSTFVPRNTTTTTSSSSSTNNTASRTSSRFSRSTSRVGVALSSPPVATRASSAPTTAATTTTPPAAAMDVRPVLHVYHLLYMSDDLPPNHTPSEAANNSNNNSNNKTSNGRRGSHALAVKSRVEENTSSMRRTATTPSTKLMAPTSATGTHDAHAFWRYHVWRCAWESQTQPHSSTMESVLSAAMRIENHYFIAQHTSSTSVASCANNNKNKIITSATSSVLLEHTALKSVVEGRGLLLELISPLFVHLHAAVCSRHITRRTSLAAQRLLACGWQHAQSPFSSSTSTSCARTTAPPKERTLSPNATVAEHKKESNNIINGGVVALKHASASGAASTMQAASGKRVLCWPRTVLESASLLGATRNNNVECVGATASSSSSPTSSWTSLALTAYAGVKEHLRQLRSDADEVALRTAVARPLHFATSADVERRRRRMKEVCRLAAERRRHASCNTAQTANTTTTTTTSSSSMAINNVAAQMPLSFSIPAARRL